MDIEMTMSLLNTTAVMIGVVAGIIFMMRYLQRGESQVSEREMTSVRKQIERQVSNMRVLLENEFSRSGISPSISDEERKALLDHLKQSLISDGAQAVLSEVESRVSEKYGEEQIQSIVYRQSSQTIERLKQELYALSRRGNLNLSIGIVTTVGGLVLLGTFVLVNPSSASDIPTFTIEFIPRLSLVVLIEVFAYFFLRLYKTTLSEIKYFQNEITSIEAKYLSLMVGANSKNEEHLKGVLEQLSRTERNFILDKGQTTIDLEKARLEHRLDSDLLAKVFGLVSKKS